MAVVRLYLDEDVHTFIAQALQLRGYEVTTTRDQRRLGTEDSDQLAFTQQHGYTLVTYNVQDYPRLHYEWLTAEKHHAGIIVSARENPRRNIRSLLNLLALVTAEEMVDQLEYLKFWEEWRRGVKELQVQRSFCKSVRDKIGVMEHWSFGILGGEAHHCTTPILHHSNLISYLTFIFHPKIRSLGNGR